MSMLKLRAEIKARKPAFIRQDNPKRMKVNGKWRKPKGVHSKIRHKFKGRRKMPSVGYKSPFEVRGLHISGMSMVSISTVKELDGINSKTEGIVVSKNVGMRKRLDIFREAKAKKLHVLNLNVDNHISKLEEQFSSRKKSKKPSKAVHKKEEKKEDEKHPESKEHSHEHKEHKETKHDNLEEEKKKAEKKEKDKVLTQKV